jgi:soluble lytic murein transglycosylase-like protein
VTPIYSRFIRHENPRLSEGEATRIAQGIIGFSLQYKVDARLIMAMVMVESGFDPNAVSRTGAMGLGQLMPGTASDLAVSHPFDSMDNLYGTVKLVRSNLDQYKAQTGKDFDALVLSLAAYNAGPGAVRRAGGVPAYQETQNYVRKVISLYYQLSGAA